MDNHPSMTFKDLVVLAYEADQLYYKVYLEWCSELGRVPAGAPGMHGFDSSAEVRSHVACRLEEIKGMRRDIEAARGQVDDKKNIDETISMMEEIRAMVK